MQITLKVRIGMCFECYIVVCLLCFVQIGGHCVLATSACSLVVINVSNQVNHI